MPPEVVEPVISILNFAYPNSVPSILPPHFLQIGPYPVPLPVQLIAQPPMRVPRAFLPKVAARPRLLTNGEVSTPNLAERGRAAVLALVSPVTAGEGAPCHSRRRLGLDTPAEPRIVHHLIVPTAVQFNGRTRVDVVVVIRTKALDLLGPIVPSMSLPTPTASWVVISLQNDAPVFLINFHRGTDRHEATLDSRRLTRLVYQVVIAGEEEVYRPVLRERRAPVHGQATSGLGRVPPADHRIEQIVQRPEQNRVDVEVDGHRVVRQGVRVQLEQLLLLAAPAHLNGTAEEFAPDLRGVDGRLLYANVVAQGAQV
mmetsp:Transcript_62556/g.185009  ORF Transcript_62556/g.185009 Transcript_62556/m.185009 type:complete len:313 (-) Transcript_62556:214-1152(-)